jgi:hypothetical protein
MARVLVMVLMARRGLSRLFGTGERARDRLRSSADQHDEQQPESASTHCLEYMTHRSRPHLEHYSSPRRNRSAFTLTETTLNVIAALATILPPSIKRVPQ